MISLCLRLSLPSFPAFSNFTPQLLQHWQTWNMLPFRNSLWELHRWHWGQSSSLGPPVALANSPSPNYPLQCRVLSNRRLHWHNASPIFAKAQALQNYGEQGVELIKASPGDPAPFKSMLLTLPNHCFTRVWNNCWLQSLGFQVVIAKLENHAIKNRPSLISTAISTGVAH